MKILLRPPYGGPVTWTEPGTLDGDPGGAAELAAFLSALGGALVPATPTGPHVPAEITSPYGVAWAARMLWPGCEIDHLPPIGDDDALPGAVF